MSTKGIIIIILINYSIFVVLRYLNILAGFLLGLGASNHVEKWYVDWIHLPTLLIQLLALFILYRKKKRIGYVFTVIMLTLLFFSSHYFFSSTFVLPK